MSAENDNFYRGAGNQVIGEELRRFFLMLLEDPRALRQYYDRGAEEQDAAETPRSRLINEQDMSNETKDLLKEGKLKDVEEHILAIDGSYAKPLHIVWML